MIITESLRHETSAAAGATAPVTMSADLPVNGSSLSSSSSSSGDCSGSNTCSSPVTNGYGGGGGSNNNNNNNGTDFCKGGSRRKQSKPSRVSATEGGSGGGGSGGLLGDSGGSCGGSGSSPFGVSCSLVDGEGQPQLGVKVGDYSAAMAMSAPHDESASMGAGGSSSNSSNDVVNYPCHQCSRTFATLLLREQHVHAEHASETTRSASFPTAYHRLASDLAHSAASTMAAAVGVALPSKSRDGRSLLSAYASPPGQTPSKSMPTAAAAAAGFSPTVFHPEAYCDICQREFCNKYFLKTHRANIHGIYATEAGAAGGAGAAGAPSPSGSNSRDPSAPLQQLNSTPVVGAPDGERESAVAGAATAAGAAEVAQKDGVSNTPGSSSTASFSCDICHKPFSSRLYVKKHLMNVHGVTFPPPTTAGPEPAAAVGGSRRSGWDVTAWSNSGSTAAMLAYKPALLQQQQHQRMTVTTSARSQHEASPTLGAERGDSGGAFGGYDGGGGARNSGGGGRSASAPAEPPCYSSQPQRSPLCLTVASGATGGTAASATVRIAGHSSPDVGSSESSSCPAAAEASGHVGTASGGGRGHGVSNAVAAAAAAAHGLGGQVVPFEAADLDLRMHDGGRHGHPAASEKSSKDLELQQMLGLSYMDWDDGQLSRHSADSGGRHGTGSSGGGGSSSVACSPPRKRKALEALFGYGSNGFFDAAMAVRMADRIACDICGKEVCNKYFLKAHKLKMHGVTDAGALRRQQQQQGTLLAAEAVDDEPTAAASAGHGAHGELAAPTADAGRPPSSSPSSSAAQGSVDDSQPAATASTAGCSSEPYHDALKAEAPDDGPSIDGLLAMGIDPEAYCSICKKEFCSKYFLRTHKLNMHGIIADGKVKLSPRSMPTLSTEAATLTSASAAAAAAAAAVLPVPGSPDSSAAAAAAAAGMVVGEIYKQWRWKEPANQTRVFCDICNKELCNKYFLRTHKLNKHGIVTTTTPDSGQMTTTVAGPYGSAAAGGSAGSSRQAAGGGAGSGDGGGSPAMAHSNAPSPVFQAPRHDVAGALDGALLSRSDRQMPEPGSAAATLPLAGTPFLANGNGCSSGRSSSGGGSSAAIGSASAVAASSRILGLKFDLEQTPTLQGSSPDSHQQQLAANGGGGGGGGLQLGFSDAWAFLHPAVSRKAATAASAVAAIAGAGSTPVSCSACSVLLANPEELIRHSLQTGHHVTSTALDLQQTSYEALQSDGLTPDASAAHLRQMSMAFLMSGGSSSGGGNHGRMQLGKSAAAAASGEKLYSCSRCDYKTPWLSNIYSHEQRKHGGGAGGARGGRSTEVHTCGVCLRTFSYEHSLMRHVTEYHGGAGLPTSGQATAGSSTSAVTAATSAATVVTPATSPVVMSRIKLERDTEVTASEGDLLPPSPISRAPVYATPKRRSRCPYCSKQFINKYLCQSHIRHVHGVCAASPVRAPAATTHGDHGTMYACSMCKFTCRMLSNLRMHQAIKHKMSLPLDPSDSASSNGSGGGEHEGSIGVGPQCIVKTLLTGCNDVASSPGDDSNVGIGTSTNPTSKPMTSEGQPILMQPFRIVDISGADDFAPTTVYLPVYKKVKGDALVTFTLRSVEN